MRNFKAVFKVTILNFMFWLQLLVIGLPYSKLYICTFLLLRILCYMLSRNSVSKSDLKGKVVPDRAMKERQEWK